jgi:hypothetical protein
MESAKNLTDESASKLEREKKRNKQRAKKQEQLL